MFDFASTVTLHVPLGLIDGPNREKEKLFSLIVMLLVFKRDSEGHGARPRRVTREIVTRAHGQRTGSRH